jgi:glutamate synthase domain-containing protein 3
MHPSWWKNVVTGVRNSGAVAVVEGIGDHGCEYMTGGRVVCLGETGINFGAGMSGGIAYVYDPRGVFPARCNMGMVDLERVEGAEEAAELRGLVDEHRQRTGSAAAARVLGDWPGALRDFVKVMPEDLRRVMDEQAARDAAQDDAAAAA